MRREQNRIIKVLLATPYKCSTGGIDQWAQHIVRFHEKHKEGICLEVLPMNDTGSARKFTGKTSFLNRAIRGVRVYGLAVKKLCNQLHVDRYDILHIATSASISLFKDLVMMRIAQSRGVKVILHFHFGRIPEIAECNNWEWKLLRRAIRRADGVIVLDDSSNRVLKENNLDRVYQVSNPLSPLIQELSNMHKSSIREKRRLLFVGHCVKTKGVCELVMACRGLDHIDLHLVGPITSEVKNELISISDGAEWLHIRGCMALEEVIAEMCKCDVFVLPTYTEGFPNVILESMACGCAIVTTPVGAIPEMLEEENGMHYGIMVEPRNVEQLKVAIETMLSAEKFKEECSENVRQRVNERYNIDSVWRQMVNIWRKIVAE